MQKLMKAMHKNEKGFTLVELMVVVVIIGVLVAIAVPIYNAVTDRAEASACQANQRTLDGAVMQWSTEDGATGTPDASDLAPYIVMPTCPTNDTAYVIQPPGTLHVCPDDIQSHER